MPVISAKLLVDHLVRKIQNFHKTTGATTAQLDLSGGIDSAVMAGLLTRALCPNNVYTLYSSINSSKESRNRAQLVADHFLLDLTCVDLTSVYEGIQKSLTEEFLIKENDDLIRKYDTNREKDATVDGSLRSCLRAPVGRYFNRLMGNGIRHGTGNECEDRFIRFYQKGGDGEVDTNPIASLSKGEVYQVAVELGVPEEVINATPTPDLQGVGESHNDEDELRDLTGVRWTYSRVNHKTGNYTHLGTIEAFARFLDHDLGPNAISTPEDFIFGEAPPWDEILESLHPIAQGYHRDFFNYQSFKEFAESARKLEASTRHKMNPNCPTIVERHDLVALGLLTNVLPRV